MALDRNGTGTSQGSSSNQKGGSGEGSRNQGSGAGNRGSSASKNSSNSSSSGKGASQSGGGKSSPGQSKASSDTGGKKSNSASQSSGGSVKSGGSLAGNTGLASGTSASESESGTKKGVAGRVSSVNQALSSYGAAPSYARAGYGDSLNSQRQSLAGSASQKGSDPGMSEADQRAAYSAGAAIARDHGVIANLVSRANKGIATDKERAQLTSVADAANRHSAATVVGGTVLGSPGSYIGNGLASMLDGDDYHSQLGKRIGTGEMKGVLGSVNDTFGQGGTPDAAVSVAANVASAALPGSGFLFNAISNGLKAPNSSAIAEINKALGRDIGGGSLSMSDKGYAAPPRQSLTGANQSEGTLAFDSNYYDPSRFNVTAGRRGY
ncbi:hypothetical protein ACW5WK_02730 [Aeromonas enteropelogenes]|uniref:hypothetical protein n=1 Tax=Aeromonas enteropelogenes TaxID=29489 RepID=UPI000B110343|nr:hypothetical protein [Aeromonas enteropelogenes]UBH56291.1 hypothetical protein LA341_20860 [Aeromonas enteropelogenes]